MTKAILPRKPDDWAVDPLLNRVSESAKKEVLAAHADYKAGLKDKDSSSVLVARNTILDWIYDYTRLPVCRNAHFNKKSIECLEKMSPFTKNLFVWGLSKLTEQNLQFEDKEQTDSLSWNGKIVFDIDELADAWKINLGSTSFQIKSNRNKLRSAVEDAAFDIHCCLLSELDDEGMPTTSYISPVDRLTLRDDGNTGIVFNPVCLKYLQNWKDQPSRCRVYTNFPKSIFTEKYKNRSYLQLMCRMAILASRKNDCSTSDEQYRSGRWDSPGSNKYKHYCNFVGLDTVFGWLSGVYSDIPGMKEKHRTYAPAYRKKFLDLLKKCCSDFYIAVAIGTCENTKYCFLGDVPKGFCPAENIEIDAEEHLKQIPFEDYPAYKLFFEPKYEHNPAGDNDDFVDTADRDRKKAEQKRRQCLSDIRSLPESVINNLRGQLADLREELCIEFDETTKALFTAVDKECRKMGLISDTRFLDIKMLVGHLDDLDKADAEDKDRADAEAAAAKVRAKYGAEASAKQDRKNPNTSVSDYAEEETVFKTLDKTISDADFISLKDGLRRYRYANDMRSRHIDDDVRNDMRKTLRNKGLIFDFDSFSVDLLIRYLDDTKIQTNA